MNHNNFGAKAATGSPLGSVAYCWVLRDTTRAANRPETGRNFDTDKHGGRCPDLTKKPISLWRAQRGQSGLRSIRTSKWDALTESGVLEPRGGPSRPRCLVRIKTGHAVPTLVCHCCLISVITSVCVSVCLLSTVATYLVKLNTKTDQLRQ